jgi:hypothetical protein
MEWRRLTGAEIGILRSLFTRSNGVPVTLLRRDRALVVPLWRRRLLDVWTRYVPDDGGLGPYYALTLAGQRLASHFAAPRQRRQSPHHEHHHGG